MVQLTILPIFGEWSVMVINLVEEVGVPQASGSMKCM